jgi:hypothetical protein
MLGNGRIDPKDPHENNQRDMLVNISDSLPDDAPPPDFMNVHKKAADSSQNMPLMMRIMEDVFLASHEWLLRNPARAVKIGITHIISMS